MRTFYSLLLVLFAIQLSGCSAVQGIKPSQLTTTQFLTQMQAHKYSAAYGLMSSRFKTVTSLQATQGYWVQFEKIKGKVKSWNQQGVNFYAGTGGSNVQISYSIQGEKGVGTMKFMVVPENDKWLIQGFNLTW